MGEEQRRFIRIRSRLTVFIKYLDTGKVQRALTEDVSARGLCLVTETVLTPGTKLELELKLPDRDARITFTGEVMWSKPIGGKPLKSYELPTAETGVKFVNIDPNDEKLLMLYARLNAPPPASEANDP